MDALKKYIKVLKEQEKKINNSEEPIYIRCNKRANKPMLNILVCSKCKYKNKCVDFARAKVKK